MKLDNLVGATTPKIKAILYGEPGSGKTRTSASASLDPRFGGCLLLDIVGNPHSVRDYRPAPTLIHIDDINDMEMIFKWLQGGQDPKHALQTKYKEKYNIAIPHIDTVIIDQLTGLQGLFMRQHLGNNDKMTKQKAAQFQDWGALLQFMEAVAYNYFEVLDMNVIMTALERVEVDQLTQSMSWGVGLWGQGQQVVPAYSYLVARLIRMSKISQQAVKDYRIQDCYTVAFLDQLGRYTAKDQYSTGVRFIENPTMTKILDAIEAVDARTEQETTKNPTESKG